MTMIISGLLRLMLILSDIVLDGNIFIKLYIILVQWVQLRVLQKILTTVNLQFDELKIKRQNLQWEIGPRPRVILEDFQNWATSRKTANVFKVKPRSLEEIQAVVKAARKFGLKIRCAGSTHSWSSLFADEGNILMYIKDVQRHDGPRIELLRDPDGTPKINAVCSVTVQELMEFELKNDVNLPTNVILTATSLSGLIAPGCHGVGWDFKALPDYCTQIRLVDSSSNLRTFRTSDDLDMMKAVQCGLGLFGIIYDVQIQVMEKKIARVQDDFNITANEMFFNAKNLKDLVTSNDSVEIFYWPYNSVKWSDATEQVTRLLGTSQVLTRDEWDPRNDRLWIKKVNIPDQPLVQDKKLINSCYYKVMDFCEWFESRGIRFVNKFLIQLPQEITPVLVKSSFNYLAQSTAKEVWQPLANAIHYKPNATLYSVQALEVAINVKDDFSNITTACQAVFEILRKEAEHGRFPMNVAMEMRWMKYSDAYLCPAIVGNPAEGGSGHTVYLEVLSYTDTPGWKEFANRVAQEFMKIEGTRFHWAKEWDYVQGFKQYTQQVWKPQLERFRSALETSGCDSDGMFLNKKLKTLLFSDDKELPHEEMAKQSSRCALM